MSYIMASYRFDPAKFGMRLEKVRDDDYDLAFYVFTSTGTFKSADFPVSDFFNDEDTAGDVKDAKDIKDVLFDTLGLTETHEYLIDTCASRVDETPVQIDEETFEFLMSSDFLSFKPVNDTTEKLLSYVPKSSSS